MTSPIQKQSRNRITARDFKRRAWGKSHTDRGIYIPSGGEGVIPDAQSKEERWCERCKRVGRIMHWMGKKWFRCCGWPA